MQWLLEQKIREAENAMTQNLAGDIFSGERGA
jgi:hypothetical protein